MSSFDRRLSRLLIKRWVSISLSMFPPQVSFKCMCNVIISAVMSFSRRQIVMTLKVQAWPYTTHVFRWSLCFQNLERTSHLSSSGLIVVGFDVLFIYFWTTTNVEIGDLSDWRLNLLVNLLLLSSFFCCYSTIKFCSRTILREREREREE